MRRRDSAPQPWAAAGAFAAVALCAALAPDALGAEYRAIGDPATVLYDAPSVKAKPLFVLGRDTPLEVVVPLEGWVKVRDVGGTIGWIERKEPAPSAGATATPGWVKVKHRDGQTGFVRIVQVFGL
jgi:hypothetical protein